MDAFGYGLIKHLFLRRSPPFIESNLNNDKIARVLDPEIGAWEHEVRRIVLGDDLKPVIGWYSNRAHRLVDRVSNTFTLGSCVSPRMKSTDASEERARVLS
jgi:hypothetical protein